MGIRVIHFVCRRYSTSALEIRHVGGYSPSALEIRHVGGYSPSALEIRHVGGYSPSALEIRHVGGYSPSALEIRHVGGYSPSALESRLVGAIVEYRHFHSVYPTLPAIHSSSSCCSSAGRRLTPHSHTLEVRPGRIYKKIELHYDYDVKGMILTYYSVCW